MMDSKVRQGRSRALHVFVLPDLDMGGVSGTVCRLHRSMSAQGVKCEVILFRKSNQNAIQVEGSPIVLFPEVRDYRFILLLWPILIYRLWRALNLVSATSHNYVSSSHGLLSNVAVSLIRYLTNSPFSSIAYLHDSISGHYGSTRTGRLKRKVLALSLRWHSAAVAVSEGVKSEIVDISPELSGKVFCVHNGIDIDSVISRSTSPLPAYLYEMFEKFSEQGRRIIVSIGRLAPQKDYSTLLRVARQLQNSPIVFVIVGDGPLRESLSSSIASETLTNVVLVGALDNPMPLLARADLFLLTSRHESFGNVLVEALSLGRPVVSTNCPSGPREILGDLPGTYLVPVGQDIEIAKAIELSLSQDAGLVRNDLIRRARLFDTKVQAHKYLALFDSLVNRDQLVSSGRSLRFRQVDRAE